MDLLMSILLAFQISYKVKCLNLDVITVLWIHFNIAMFYCMNNWNHLSICYGFVNPWNNYWLCIHQGYTLLHISLALHFIVSWSQAEENQAVLCQYFFSCHCITWANWVNTSLLILYLLLSTGCCYISGLYIPVKVNLDISGSPIGFHSGSRKYPV